MDDLFHPIYEHALSSGALNPDLDPEYRHAYHSLNDLLGQYVPNETEQDLLRCAVFSLLACSDRVSLAYGFRLAARSILD